MFAVIANASHKYLFHITKASDSNNVNSNGYLLNVVYRKARGAIRGGPEIYLLTARPDRLRNPPTSIQLATVALSPEVQLSVR